MAEQTKYEEEKLYSIKPRYFPKKRITFDKAVSLQNIEGYVWYTPAILYCYGRFTDTNLWDLPLGDSFNIYWHQFDKPIFSGLYDGENSNGWNNILWAAEADKWSLFVSHVLDTIQFDIPSKSLWTYALQEFPILDPLFQDKKIITDTQDAKIIVNGFASISNVGQIIFDVINRKYPDTLPVTILPTTSQHKLVATKLFAGSAPLTNEIIFERYRELMREAQVQEFNRMLQETSKSK